MFYTKIRKYIILVPVHGKQILFSFYICIGKKNHDIKKTEIIIIMILVLILRLINNYFQVTSKFIKNNINIYTLKVPKS
jgi:hypothetical protein